MFFRKSFTDSITARFRNSILSIISISLFFMFFRSLVINWIPCRYKRSNSTSEIYPLSSNSFPLSSRHKKPMTSKFRSSMLPAVRQKKHISPMSLIIRCSLKPSCGTFLSFSPSFEHFMAVNAPVMAHFQGC
jgi:hypothetical protein